MHANLSLGPGPRFRNLVPAVVFFCATIFSSAAAQQEFFPGGTYRPEVKSPADYLGYELGKKFTPHYRIVEYMRYLDRVSDRVQLRQYGETNEGRPLLAAFISSPSNLQQLEAIRRDLLALRQVPPPADVERIFASRPVAVWLSYGVHGNESSSAEAAMQTAYQLAAGTDSVTLAILTHAVTVVDPLLNPDGRDRYVNWYNGAVGDRPNPDPVSFEHDEPWPGGRTNHYYFDLNRDWAWLTQKETRARMKLYRQWYPQVHVDFHEMGYNETYFFFPPHGPVLKDFPEETRQWMGLFGQNLARAFDRFGWQYYTAEDFDLFYPGYGDSWPSLNGAIGMTYEQAGGGRGGLVVRRRDGTRLSLRERIQHHFVAGITTLQTAVSNREKRLRDYHKFYVTAIEEARRADFDGYLLLPGRSQERFRELLSRLQLQGIDVRRVAAATEIKNAEELISGKRTAVDVAPPAAYLPLEQTAARLLRVLMEPRPVLSDTFFYDITSWSFPAAYGVRAYRVRDGRFAKLQPWEEGEKKVENAARGQFAYLFHWDDIATAGLLSELMEKGVRCYATRKPFTLNGEKFTPGDVIIPVGANRDVKDFHDVVRRGADRWAVKLFATNSGLTESGIDLGSRNVQWIRQPKLLVATDYPVSSSGFGVLWFLFDRRLHMPITPVRTLRLRSLRLKEYNTLVLPDAWGGYGSVLDSSFQKRLRAWVQEGGVVIGIGAGARFLIQAKLSRNKIKTEKKARKDTTAARKKAAEALKKATRTWEQKQKDRIRDRVPGAIFRLRVDTTHPLGFGQEPEVYLLKFNKQVFELSDRVHVVGWIPEKAHVAGFLSDKNKKLMENSAVVTVESLGAGKVILFADEMIFRHFWRATTGLLLNAVFMGSVM